MADSREKMPLASYRRGHLLAALPLAIIFGIFLLLWRLTVRKKFPDTTAIPRNAIICFFHSDLYAGMLAMDLYARFSTRGGWVLGVHHFISYLWSAETYLRGWPVWRFHPGARGAIKAKLVEFLARPEVHTLRYATDSGGPYGVVRRSVVELSLATGRPVVLNRIFATKYVTFRSHRLPLPFCTVEPMFSAPVTSAELTRLPIDAARELLQTTVDRLVPSK